MTTPDQLEPAAALNAALAAAQGEFPPITRDKTVNTGTYTFSYADLATILGIVRPILAKHGLALTQPLEDNGRGPAIRTELRHAQGGVLGASFPLPGTPTKPQELGSLLTYIRRYAICALLGIAADEDDDGQQAANTPMRKPQPGPRQKIVVGPEADPLEEPGPDFGPVEDPADQQLEPTTPFQAPEPREADRKKRHRQIYALITKLDKSGQPGLDKDTIHAAMGIEYGIETVTELTDQQADNLIQRLVRKEKELGL